MSCVGWLAVYACGDVAIWKACDVDVKEGNGAIYFFLAGKFDLRVNGIQAFVDVRAERQGRGWYLIRHQHSSM
jgi:hypothetical protein